MKRPAPEVMRSRDHQTKTPLRPETVSLLPARAISLHLQCRFQALDAMISLCHKGIFEFGASKGSTHDLEHMKTLSVKMHQGLIVGGLSQFRFGHDDLRSSCEKFLSQILCGCAIVDNTLGRLGPFGSRLFV